MGNYSHFYVFRKKILFFFLLALAAAFFFVELISYANAGALDGDHMQDATGADSVVTNQVVRKGWGFVQGNGLFAIEDTTINYGITFDELPFLIVKFANSRQVADGAPANLSECTTTRKVIAAGVNQTTSGFKPILRTPTDLGFPSLTNYCYTWIAIGRHDSSYDGNSQIGLNFEGYIPRWNGTELVSGGIFDDGAGKIGIGTASPLFALDVTGNIRATNTISAGYYYGDGANLTGITGKWDVAGSTYYYNDGPVGIGTSTPSYGLHVIGNVGASSLYLTGNADIDGEIMASTYYGDGSNLSGIAGTWDVSGTDYYYKAGNVGIGTASPSTALHVDGVITTSGGTSTEWNNAFSWGNHAVQGYLTSYTETDPEVGSNILDYVPKWDGSALAAGSIFDNGNVGIGTTAPEEKLTLSSGNFLQTVGNPIHKGSIADDTTMALDGPSSIYVAGKNAYVTSSNNDGVEVLDISNPLYPTHLGAITDDVSTALNTPRDIFVSGQYAYVTSGAENGVEVLDISDPSNPSHAGAIFGSYGGLLDNAYNVYVSGKYAYVTSSAYVGGGGGLFILDISDPTVPTRVGSFTDNESRLVSGLRGIHVSGKYAYVTSYVEDGVAILDVSDPTSPVQVGSIVDDTTTELDGADDIYVSGKYAYVASYTDSGVEVLDVSDPTNPVHVGAIADDSTTALQYANSIYVAGNYAYVSSAGEDGIEVLDISNPSNPVHAGKVIDDATTRLDSASGVYVSGKYAYAIGSVDDGVEILDISGIDAPAANIGTISANTIDVSENLQVGNNLHVKDGLSVGVGGIFSGGDFGIEGDFLQTADNPVRKGYTVDNSTKALDGPSAIYVAGKNAYVTSSNDDGVEVLDISNPSYPTHLGVITDDVSTALNTPRDIFVSGQYAYVTSGAENGVEVLDVSDPSNPSHAGAIFGSYGGLLDNAYNVYVSGKYAYVTSSAYVGGGGGLFILDISDPTVPAHVGSFTDNEARLVSGLRGIHVSGKYAYVTSYVEDGVAILDVSDPTSPVQVGSIVDDTTTELDGADDIYVSGKYAYVASYTDSGVEVLDVSDPTNPVHVGAIADDSTTALQYANSIYVAGNYAYVSSAGEDGIEVLDISNPSNPVHAGVVIDDVTTRLDGASGVYVSGKYAYAIGAIDDGVEILDISGIDAPAANIGSISANTINVSENLQVGNNLNVWDGLSVGVGGILSGGDLSVNGNTILNGDLTISGSCTGCSSDLTLKKNINTLKSSLEKINLISGVSFDWKDGIKEAGIYRGRQIGVIAQEVEKVFPEIVGIDSRGYKYVEYQKLVVPLIESIKELNAKNAKLKLVNDEQQYRIKNLEIKNDLLWGHLCTDDISSEICAYKN